MKPAVFLDRDGVIVDESDYPIIHARQVVLLPGAAQAIARLNAAGWPVVVVTNQAIIARGYATIAQLEAVHARMIALLREQAGAHIDALYYCPHHPNPSQSGRAEAYCIECECRKPAPGLLRKAAREMDLDLRASWLVGDARSDVLTGRRAEVRTILLTESGKGGEDESCEAEPDFVARTLTEAVDIIVKKSVRHD